MAMVSDICQQESENDATRFDMGALRANLPQKRKGLSAFYSGKSQSFTSLEDVHCVEDLKKPEIPKAKKKKYSISQCRRRISDSSPHLPTPFVGF